MEQVNIPIERNGRMIRLELDEAVAHPSHLSTALLFAVDDAEIADRTVFDVGCGSGYLGLGLLARRARFLYGSDVSAAAVERAERVAALNGLEDRARFRQGRFFEPFRDSFAPGDEVDVVVSNPPQSPREMVVGSYARKLAVDGGTRGDELLKAVLRGAHLWLKRDGCAYLATSSLAAPGSVLREAEALFEEVRVVAEHEVPFDLWRLEKWEVLRRLEKEGSAEIVVKDGFPYWLVRLLRCRFPSGRG